MTTEGQPLLSREPPIKPVEPFFDARYLRFIAAFGALLVGMFASSIGGGATVLVLMTAGAVIVPLGLALTLDRSSNEAFRVVAALLPLSVFAIGTATNHTVKTGAAVTLAGGMLLAAVWLAFVASCRSWPSSKLAAKCFVFEGAPLFGTMALAVTFAVTAHGAGGVS